MHPLIFIRTPPILIGAVLYRIALSTKVLPVAVGNHALNPTECQWIIPKQKEYNAIVYSLWKLEYLPTGRRCNLLTDHKVKR